jgi:hypothetical protein
MVLARSNRPIHEATIWLEKVPFQWVWLKQTAQCTIEWTFVGSTKTFQNEQTSKLAYLRVFSIGRLNAHCQHWTAGSL